MKGCVLHDLLGQPVEQAAACVIDTDKNTCEVVTAVQDTTDAGDLCATIERKQQRASRAVTRLLYSTCNLTALELDNDFCIEHLEDQLQVRTRTRRQQLLAGDRRACASPLPICSPVP